jgi:outer membrane protein assembly factor BamB
MTDHIAEMLGALPTSAEPEPGFEARLRRSLAADLRAPLGASVDGGAAHETTTTEVLELDATTPEIIRTPRTAVWLRVAAAAAVVALGVGAVASALQEDDGAPTAATVPDATFVGATLDTTAIDMTTNDPYFVAAAGDAWVLTLAGDLIRIDGRGVAAQVTSVPESSPLAVDDDAVWIADAVDGRVLRLDPTDGSVVAEIATGIEVQPNTVRVPMVEGGSRQFAQIGGIVADGESVWVGDRSGQVLRIDPEANEIVDSFDVPVRPDQLHIDGEHLLVVNLTGNEAAVVDSTTGAVVRTSDDIEDLAGAAVHGGALYLQDATDGTVTRIDLETGDQRTSQHLGASAAHVGQPVLPTAPVVTSAGVLVHTDTAPDSLHVLDPTTLEETGTLAVAPDYGDMAVAPDGSVWLVRGNMHQVVHIVPRPL